MTLRPLAAIEDRACVIHGYRRAFRVAGNPRSAPLLLLHGIGDSSETWRDVMPLLGQRYHVIAPDLLGHGDSDKPRADYSIGGFANGMRDLLTLLEVEKVTVVGHSLGGGVAMQFAYQYPHMVERIVLVSNGGSGRGVSIWLRAASMPFGPLALQLLRLPGAGAFVEGFLALLRMLDSDLGVDADDLARVVTALPDPESRRAFAQTLRSVIDWRGQVVTMLDRSYLARDIPLLMVWGDRDAIVPFRHASQAKAALPDATLEVFHGTGHFPFRSDPQRFADVVEDFLAATAPRTWDAAAWQRILREGAPG